MAQRDGTARWHYAAHSVHCTIRLRSARCTTRGWLRAVHGTHLEAHGVAGVIKTLEQLGVERARVGIGQADRPELPQQLAEHLVGASPRLSREGGLG